MPAPRRGELVRLLGEELRAAKADLGRLVTIEAGKIVSEGLGEVQEMIDICDFAVGLSRQLYGLTIATERPGHRMMETWHPLGVCGVITAFNFPVAVWSWNAALAFVCGDPVVWKPSEKTPLTALAVKALVERAAQALRRGAGGLVRGAHRRARGRRGAGRRRARAARLGDRLDRHGPRGGAAPRAALRARDPRARRQQRRDRDALGRSRPRLARHRLRGDRHGRPALHQLRRLIVHESVHDKLVARLKQAYSGVRIGDPREPGVLVGPLIDDPALNGMEHALAEARSAGGRVHGGERALADRFPEAAYVHPALVEMPSQTGPMPRETFAPILYVVRYRELDEAIAIHNDVGAGLSSSIFTTDLREAERFMSAAGSDCGIANVNIGPSGAEIGGAFGGEKETGGGREAGSDAWKAYMRRATNTVNFSSALPLAQGVSFDVEG